MRSSALLAGQTVVRTVVLPRSRALLEQRCRYDRHLRLQRPDGHRGHRGAAAPGQRGCRKTSRVVGFDDIPAGGGDLSGADDGGAADRRDGHDRGAAHSRSHRAARGADAADLLATRIVVRESTAPPAESLTLTVASGVRMAGGSSQTSRIQSGVQRSREDAARRRAGEQPRRSTMARNSAERS